MPNRPPKQWWDDCVAGVGRGGAAYDPSRVCGAVWARKSPAEKRYATATHESSSEMKRSRTKAKRGRPAKKTTKGRPAARGKAFKTIGQKQEQEAKAFAAKLKCKMCKGSKSRKCLVCEARKAKDKLK